MPLTIKGISLSLSLSEIATVSSSLFGAGEGRSSLKFSGRSMLNEVRELISHVLSPGLHCIRVLQEQREALRLLVQEGLSSKADETLLQENKQEEEKEIQVLPRLDGSADDDDNDVEETEDGQICMKKASFIRTSVFWEIECL